MKQLEAIKEAGRKAAEARRNQDEPTAKFHTDWANKAARLEDDPSAAKQAFQDAYREHNEQYRTGSKGVNRWVSR